jgi:hypothetical protein
MARPLGSSRVRAMYLLSLYFDDGAYGCALGLVLCGGHYGDSEYIVLDLYFGGTGLDECRADTFQRIVTPDSRDIGSRARHTAAQDCARSVVFTSSTAVECYWTTRDFGG